MSSYDNMTDDEAKFCEFCKAIAGADWDEYKREYSFPSAYRQGMTPEAAVKDCKEWLEG